MSYEEEGKALIEKYMKLHEQSWEKYKGYPGKAGPGAVEQRRLSELFREEQRALMKKYGITGPQ